MSDSPKTPARARHDGWTGERRRAFLDTLAKVGNVRDACRQIGLSNQAAYRLRARDPGFAADWDAALKRAGVSLEAVAYARAVEGVEEPIFHGGVQVGTRRKTSDALLRLLMQAADPEKYGRTGKGAPVQLREEMEKELEARVQEIEYAAYNRAFIALQQEAFYKIDCEVSRNGLWRELSIIHAKLCVNPKCRECRPDRAEASRDNHVAVEWWEAETEPGEDHQPIDPPIRWAKP